MRAFALVAVPLLAAFAAPRADAAFHVMQIEQVIGGVDGDPAQQAIQLRLRTGGQNVVSLSRLRAFDAGGGNPVLLIDIVGDVGNGGTGDRVLLATAAFAAAQGITPDFLLAAPIPPAYLAAGRLTFEHDGSTIYWSLAWGGAGYTGAHGGDPTNDADGNFGPAFAGALPSDGARALRFRGVATDPSTSNAADYAPTPGAARFANNAGAQVVVERVHAAGFE
jgi:hypothetical protein